MQQSFIFKKVYIHVEFGTELVSPLYDILMSY